MHQRRGALAQRDGVVLAHLTDALDRAGLAAVNRDEVVVAQEEIDVVRDEAVLARLEVDPVEDQVQVVAVRLDFGMMRGAESVFHRQVVEVEDVGEDAAFFRCRVDEVDPEHRLAVWREPGRIDPIRRNGLSILVDVDLDQSPTFTCSAA